MQITKISPNISIANDGFGNFDTDVISKLLRHIDMNFSRASGKVSSSSKNVLVVKSQDCPGISDSQGGHIIKLTTKNNLWCQWIYQFAHEYCHHLINGKMIAYLRGLEWFEETLCEVSSIYNLICIERNWETMFPEYDDYKESIRSYIYDLLLEKDIMETNTIGNYIMI